MAKYILKHADQTSDIYNMLYTINTQTSDYKNIDNLCKITIVDGKL